MLAISLAGVALYPSIFVFYTMNMLFGIVQSISSVATAPFLMENSGEEERTYLFSFTSGLRMGSVFVGNWLGGYLPTWLGNLRGFDPTSSTAYGGALLSISVIAIVGFIPLLFVQSENGKESQTRNFSPISFARENPSLLTKILVPSFIISIGAGLFIPFMNVFFRVVHGQSDQVIGTLFAWGSLAMGIGLMIAPPIADRLGKIRLVMVTQGLAIPFMMILGFAPIFGLSAMAYFVRMALMNMSNPIYQTFIMEQVDAASRATVASLYSMVWSFGRAFSPSISGWLQVEYGFNPVFGGAILMYAIAVTLYWVFFLRPQRETGRLPVPGD
jgi:MFS family permease